MRKAKFITIFSLLCICLCACSSQIDDNTDDALITLTVADSSARTVLPTEISSVENYTDFVLSGTKNGTTETLATFSTYSALRNSSIGISTGTWNFVLTAKQGNVSLSGNIRNKTIIAGSNSLSFSMDIAGYGETGDVGSIRFSLQLPTGNAVRSIQTELISVARDETLTSFTVKANSSINNTFVYNKSNVPVGIYRIKIHLFADADYRALINTYSELILVAASCISESTYTMNSLNPVYSITYNLNGGYIDPNYILPQSFSRLSNFSLPSVKYVKNTNGDAFVGWYTDENFTSARKFSLESGTTENITLYAKWSASAIAIDSSDLPTLNLSAIQEEKTLIVTGDLSSAEQVYLSRALENASASISLDLSAANITEIGDYAFENCTELSSILIPETVNSIGKGAFKGCTKLSNINMPPTLTAIKDYTFDNCTELQSIDIPASVSSIGAYAFNKCEKLRNVNLPERLTSLGANSFSNCSLLEEIAIPSGITEIPNYAFSNDVSLQTISLHNNITSIGNYAFYSCTSMTSFSFPQNLASIGTYAFDGCTKLIVVILPSSVTSVGSYAFENCSGLKNITLSSGLKVIDVGVFKNCASLQAITIPPSVASIGNYAFNGCSALSRVTISNGTSALTLGYHTYCSTGEGKGLFYDCPLESAAIERDLDYNDNNWNYGRSPFSGLTTLTTATFGSKVTIIKGYLFYKCKNLNSVQLPTTITTIGAYAFGECKLLQTINLPSSVSTLGTFAFYNCSSLDTTFAIPSAINTIKSSVFRGCTKLKFTFKENKKWAYSGSYGRAYSNQTWYYSGSHIVTTEDTYTFFVDEQRTDYYNSLINFDWTKS